MWPSVVTHTRNSCSTFNPSKVRTHTHAHAHTHTRSSGHPFYAAAPGEQLRVWCLAQGYLSRGIEVERALDIYSPHLQFLPARDSNLQPLVHDQMTQSILFSESYSGNTVANAKFTLHDFSPIFHAPTGFDKSPTNARTNARQIGARSYRP